MDQQVILTILGSIPPEIFWVLGGVLLLVVCMMSELSFKYKQIKIGLKFRRRRGSKT